VRQLPTFTPLAFGIARVSSSGKFLVWLRLVPGAGTPADSNGSRRRTPDQKDTDATAEASPARAVNVRARLSATEKLVEAAQELSTVRDLTSIMAVVRRAARELTNADGATFVLREGDLCIYADENAISPLWKGRRFPISDCISGWERWLCKHDPASSKATSGEADRRAPRVTKREPEPPQAERQTK
jgi:hypothetical protein